MTAFGAGFVQRAFDAAQVIDALLDLESQPARHQRRRLAPADVVENRHAQTADLEHVAKALRCDQARRARPCLRECALVATVVAVHDLRDLSRSARRRCRRWLSRPAAMPRL